MNFLLIKSTIIALIITAIIERASMQTAEQLLEFLHAKIQNLEATGQIARDYQPYIEPQLENNDYYDFIIIGGGAAGAALARRLSEIPYWKILLLEAGGEPDIVTDIPLWSALTIAGTDLNWRYRTEPDPNFGLGYTDQRLYWHTGKGLGGSTLLSYMFYYRGTREDYDLWAKLGNSGWGYKDVLHYLKKLETCNVPNQDTSFRGHDGPVYVEHIHPTKAGEIFWEAGANAGYSDVDYNGMNQIGVSTLQAFTKRGLRCTAENSYIRPVKNRGNLNIRLRSHVTKIIFKDKQAIGVEFLKNDRIYRAFAKKEVILSAGAINSPQILLLSGIGPEKQLNKFGIKTLVDLPVGEKLVDHQAYFGLGFTLNAPIQINATAVFEDNAFVQLYNDGTGVLDSAGGADGIIFTKLIPSCDPRPDTAIVVLASYFNAGPVNGLESLFNISKEFCGAMYQDLVGKNAISCVPVVLHPKSCGYLELQSADPLDHLKIYPRYFTDPKGDDIRTLIAGIRECMRIMTSPPYDQYDIEVIDKPMIGCEDKEYNSDEYWECAIRTLGGTTYDPTMTCKMGPPNDKEAVVDNKLQVYGVKNLRVVDSSIFPVPFTYLNVPTYMVAEKASDIIKSKYLGRY